MHFIARALDPATRSVVSVPLEAVNADQARGLAESRGLHVIELQPAAAPRRAAAGLSEREIQLFCRELSSLLKAGLSVVEALEALDAQQQRQAQGSGRATSSGLHAGLLQQLREGAALSVALAALPGAPALLVASVQASERTSNLVEAMDAYLKYAELVQRLRSRVLSAALYPSIVISLGACITVFLLAVVVPRFAALYAQMGPAAGGTTRALLALSSWLKAAPWLVPLLGVLLVGGVVALLHQGRWRAVLAWVVEAVPYLRRQARQLELTRLYEALAMLTRGGYSLFESLELCKSIATRPAQRARLADAQRQIAEGQSVSTAFAAADITDAVTERLLRAGQSGGDFAAVLHAVSQRHAEAFETFVERATRVVEPLLLLLVAILVGGLVVTLYMPIFDIASSIR